MNIHVIVPDPPPVPAVRDCITFMIRIHCQVVGVKIGQLAKIPGQLGKTFTIIVCDAASARKQDMSNKCWPNVGATSATLAQH